MRMLGFLPNSCYLVNAVTYRLNFMTDEKLLTIICGDVIDATAHLFPGSL